MTKINFFLLPTFRRVTLFGSVRACQNFSSGPFLQVDLSEGIKRITMADVKTKNSLSLKMVSQLKDALTENKDDHDLRCIVITAKGPVFSSGFNLKELANPNCRKVFNDFNEVMHAMMKSPVPVITAVNGLAAAAGCQLVAQSDIAICTHSSTFSTPGASFGIFCSSPGIPLVRSVNRKVAMYMLFTGSSLSADQALVSGLVSHVTEEDQLDKLIKEITDGIKSKSRSVIELGKAFVYEQLEMNIMSAYEKSADMMKKNLEMDDGVEGIKSFIEKRKPVWKN